MKENQYFSAKMHINCQRLFIGDICYALRDDKYEGVWGANNYDDGIIEDNECVYGIAVGTKYGDGVYFDEYDHRYLVDAAVIGVSNMDYLREDDFLYGGFVLELKCTDIEVNVSYEDGKIHIVVYDDNVKLLFDRIIDTDPTDEDDEEDFDDED